MSRQGPPERLMDTSSIVTVGIIIALVVLAYQVNVILPH